MYTIIGLLTGVYLDWVFDIQLVYPAFKLIPLLSALLFGLSYNGHHGWRLLTYSILGALFLCWPLFLSVPDFLSSHPNPPAQSLGEVAEKVQGALHLLSYLIGFPLVFYVVHAFFYAMYREQKLFPSYQQLFLAVWNTVPLVSTAILFLLLAQGLIYLTALIFQSTGSEQPWHFLVQNHHFQLISTAMLFFIGIGIARQNESLINQLRQLVLSIFYYLLPFLSLIILLYLVLFLIFGHSPSGIMPTLIILGIVFYNAYFQDGSNERPYPLLIGLLIRAALVVMAILAYIYTKHLLLYIIPPSLFPLNIGLYIAVVVGYAFVYATAALFPTHMEIAIIKKANIGIAVFFVFLMQCANNPWKPIGNYDLRKILPYSTQSISALYPVGPGGIFIDPTDTSPSNSQYITIEPSPLPIILPSPQQQLSFDKELQEIELFLHLTGLSWEPFKKGSITNYHPQICQVLFQKGFELGGVEKGKCLISYGGKVYTSSKYMVLSGSWQNTQWRPASESALVLGLEYRPEHMPLSPETFTPAQSGFLRSLNACRVKVNGKYFIGKTIDGHCNISYQSKVRSYANYQVLGYTTATMMRLQPQLINKLLQQQDLSFSTNKKYKMFVAGRGEFGSIGICQVPYQDDLQIGSYVNGKCYITINGQVIISEDAPFLVLTGTQSPKWKRSKARPQINNLTNRFIHLGFIRNSDGRDVHYLYACRTIVNNSIHIGKLIDNECYVSCDGKELRIPLKLSTLLAWPEDQSNGLTSLSP